MEVSSSFGMPALAIVLSVQASTLGIVHSLRFTTVDRDSARSMTTASLPWQAELSSYEPILIETDDQQSAISDSTTTQIWDRLRAGFDLSYRNNAAVQTQIESYRKQAYFLTQNLQRCESYLFYVLNRVEERGLPAELALLPLIESAYDPFARSPAGAVGIWQFMQGTADEAGLQRDWWFDGRRDIIASTAAALDYLTSLHDRYGDWQLALAAYNAGSARVDRAIRSNRRLGRPVDIQHLPLPEETRNYVPKLIALRAIIKDPERFGITLPDLADTRYFRAVEADGPVDLQVAARLAGTTLDEMQRLNPGFTRSVVPAGRPHRLLIPARTTWGFRERLARLPEEQRVQSVRYRVQPGDTLSAIAQNSRTTVRHLRSINQLENSRIVAGSVLIVPVTESEQDNNSSLVASAVNE